MSISLDKIMSTMVVQREQSKDNTAYREYEMIQEAHQGIARL